MRHDLLRSTLFSTLLLGLAPGLEAQCGEWQQPLPTSAPAPLQTLTVEPSGQIVVALGAASVSIFGRYDACGAPLAFSFHNVGPEGSARDLVADSSVPGRSVVAFERGYGFLQSSSVSGVVLLTNDAVIEHVAATSAGGYVFAGRRPAPSFWQAGPWLWILHTDANLQTLWELTLDPNTQPATDDHVEVNGVATASDGGILVGMTLLPDQNVSQLPSSAMVVRFEANGSQTWSNTYTPTGASPGADDSWLEDLIACPAGGFALTGGALPTEALDDEHVFVARVDQAGQLLWDYVDDSLTRATGAALAEAPNGNLIVMAADRAGSGYRPAALVLDSGGALVSTRTYPSTPPQTNPEHVASAPGGAFVWAGNESGSWPWLGRSEAPCELLAMVTISNVFINPAVCHETTIEWTTDVPATCTVDWGLANAGLPFSTATPLGTFHTVTIPTAQKKTYQALLRASSSRSLGCTLVGGHYATWLKPKLCAIAP